MPADIQAMIRKGYCRTSSKYGLVSRIDRSDWKEYMAKAHSPWDINEGHTWVKLLGRNAADHYRRIYSRDTKELGRSAGRIFPSSDAGPTEYIP